MEFRKPGFQVLYVNLLGSSYRIKTFNIIEKMSSYEQQKYMHILVHEKSMAIPHELNGMVGLLGYCQKLFVILLYLYSYILYVRVFLQISASLHDNAKLACVGVARAAPAHGLTELFLIKYFALLYVRSNITLHDPFLRIIIWTT